MGKLIAYFFDNFNAVPATRWFKRALYLLLMAKAVVWLTYFDLYFGADPVIFRKAVTVYEWGAPAFRLYAQASPAMGYAFIFFLLALCLLQLLWPRIYFLPDALLWFLAINIHNSLYATLSGGDYLLNQFLLFNCFLSPFSQPGQLRLGALKIVLHNFAVVAVMAQMCFVYVLSALAKLMDPVWLAGDAVWQVAQVRHYSPGALPFTKGGWPAMFLNYLVLAYQLLFPAMVWIKAVKKPFIILGVLMHLYIAFIMGLPWFGAVMLIGYIYFWPPKKQLP